MRHSAGLCVVCLLFSTGCIRVTSTASLGAIVNTTATKEEEHKAAHKPGSPIEVRSTFGGIEIVKDATRKDVLIKATLTAGGKDEEEAQAKLSEVKVRIGRQGDKLIVTHDYLGKDKVNTTGCAFKIWLPDAKGVSAVTSNGSILIKDLEGDADLKSDFGGISVTSQMGSVKARSSNGKLEIRKAGGDVTAQSDFGSLVVIQSVGAVDARTSNGQVQIEGAASVKARSDFGNVTIKRVVGDVSASTSNGMLLVDGAKAVECRSDFGSIMVKDSVGKAVVKTSNGGVTYIPAKGSPEGFDLKSDFGTITIHLPVDQKGTVHAHTDFGNFVLKGDRKPLGVEGKKPDWHVRLSEAGPASKAFTSNGTVTLFLD